MELCSLFDSVSVSFVEGVDAMNGAMLLGAPEFLAAARVHGKVLGGGAFSLLPYWLDCQVHCQCDAHARGLPYSCLPKCVCALARRVRSLPLRAARSASTPRLLVLAPFP